MTTEEGNSLSPIDLSTHGPLGERNLCIEESHPGFIAATRCFQEQLFNERLANNKRLQEIQTELEHKLEIAENTIKDMKTTLTNIDKIVQHHNMKYSDSKPTTSSSVTLPPRAPVQYVSLPPSVPSATKRSRIPLSTSLTASSSSSHSSHLEDAFQGMPTNLLEAHLPFTCSFCLSRFPTQDEQNKHEASHKAGGVLNCKVCGLQFFGKERLGRLRLHIKLKHQ